jgi:radical SAM protein with 4Fe4S-binding SPASM domain
MWREIGAKRVCFIGGEPTLHPHLKEAIRYANNLGYEEVIMDTNGIPPALNILEKIDPSDLTYIQVSLDGASSETHDQIRGKGTFEMTLKTIKELSNRGFDVRIICTVNKINMKDCLNILKIADNFGINLVKYHVCSEEGNSRDSPNIILDPYTWIEFTENLSSFAKGYKTTVLYQQTYARKELGYRYFEKGYRGCIGRTLSKVSIFPDGKMYLCSYLFDTDLNFAEIVDNQIRLNKELNELHLFITTQKMCKDCQFIGTCYGGCPAEKVVTGTLTCQKYSDIFPMCRLWKVKA